MNRAGLVARDTDRELFSAAPGDFTFRPRAVYKMRRHAQFFDSLHAFAEKIVRLEVIKKKVALEPVDNQSAQIL